MSYLDEMMDRRIIAIIAFCMMMVLPAWPSAAQQSVRDEAFIRGVSAYSAGRTEAAVKLLSTLVKVDSQDDAAWYYLGLCAISQKDMAAAREYFSKAVAIDSTNYWYRDALVSTYSFGAEDLDEAIAQYEKLRRDFPKKKDQQFILVRLYYAAGDYASALSSLDEIEGAYGKTDASVMTRFRILSDQDKKEEAQAVLKDYVAEYSSPYALSILGDYEMGLYNDDAARAYYDEALSLESGYFPARLGKAETFRLTRKYPEFFSMLKEMASDAEVPANMKAGYYMDLLRSTDQRFATTFRPQLDSVMTLSLEVAPADTTLLRTAGTYYFYVGETDNAVSTFRKFRDAAPAVPAAHVAYIQALVSGEDWKAVTQACAEAEEAFPDNTYFLQAGYIAKYNLKDYQGVIEKAEKLLSKAQGDTTKTLEALSLMGDMKVRIGQEKAAYKDYEKALKIKPDYAPVLNNYAWNLCLKGKNLSRAAKMARRAVELEPKNNSYLDTYGWILHLQGNDIEAKLFFKQAIINGGKSNPTIMAHYIVVLEALGDKDMADLYREQLKKLPPPEDE